MPCATRTSWGTWKRSQSCGGERPAVARRSLHEVESATDLGHGAGPSHRPGEPGQGVTGFTELYRAFTGCSEDQIPASVRSLRGMEQAGILPAESGGRIVMTIRRIRGVRTQRSVGDPSPQKRERRLVMRFFGSCALFVAALASLMAGGSLAVSGVAPAGASPAGITVHCPTDNLQNAINAAAAGSTLLVDGTCTGNFYINKNLTLSGPAILDGGGVATTYGATLNVISGTVVLNNLVIQHGVGIDGLGGGLWNGGQLTLNHSSVSHNTASGVRRRVQHGSVDAEQFDGIEQHRHRWRRRRHLQLRRQPPGLRPLYGCSRQPDPQLFHRVEQRRGIR